jgi:ubiquinone/menaquinone biosynthesis C-methylase UbiE
LTSSVLEVVDSFVMNTNQRLLRRVIAQFRDPTGLGGHVAGWIMSHRPSNTARNRWAVELLDIQPDDRVLELGCGPGVALAAIAERLVGGSAVGVDHSAVMIRQARRRHAAAIAAGRVHLVHTDVADLPAFDEPFDAVLAVNNVGFWNQPQLRLASLRDVLAPGARIALVSQPRGRGATATTSRAAGDELADLLAGAGYADITRATLELDPPAACVQATSVASG